jgi:hypothetical protein
MGLTNPRTERIGTPGGRVKEEAPLQGTTSRGASQGHGERCPALRPGTGRIALEWSKKKPRGRDLIGAQVWGVIERKPRLGARGFQLNAYLGSDLEGSYPMGKPSPRSNVPKNNEVIRCRVQMQG